MISIKNPCLFQMTRILLFCHKNACFEYFDYGMIDKSARTIYSGKYLAMDQWKTHIDAEENGDGTHWE